MKEMCHDYQKTVLVYLIFLTAQMFKAHAHAFIELRLWIIPLEQYLWKKWLCYDKYCRTTDLSLKQQIDY